MTQKQQQPSHSFRSINLQHNLASIIKLNILFIIYNILTLASSSFLQKVLNVDIPHFWVLTLLFSSFLLFNIFSLYFVNSSLKKKRIQYNPIFLERFIYFSIFLAISWSAVISTLNESTYKHLLVYTFTIVFCAAFFKIKARFFAIVLLLTSLALTVTILLAGLPLLNTLSLILFIILLDIMTIILGILTYRTAKQSYDANEKLRRQYEINNALMKKLEFEANCDLLTQMFNRRGFNQYLETIEQLASKQSILSIVLIDIDYFKQYNDFYGHAKGDIVLKHVATTIRKVADHYGFITARWGGEEFIAVAQDISEKELTRFCEQVRSEVHALNITHLQSQISDHITISIGSATNHCHNESTFQSTFELADEALYTAKREGRNQHYHIAKNQKETVQ